jgi:hypothetical protein
VPTIRRHPNAADIYRSKVTDLEASLNAPAIIAEASEALRALIERAMLTPDAGAPDNLRGSCMATWQRSCGSVRLRRASPGDGQAVTQITKNPTEQEF